MGPGLSWRWLTFGRAQQEVAWGPGSSQHPRVSDSGKTLSLVRKLVQEKLRMSHREHRRIEALCADSFPQASAGGDVPQNVQSSLRLLTQGQEISVVPTVGDLGQSEGGVLCILKKSICDYYQSFVSTLEGAQNLSVRNWSQLRQRHLIQVKYVRYWIGCILHTCGVKEGHAH